MQTEEKMVMNKIYEANRLMSLNIFNIIIRKQYPSEIRS
jgi:hypothetical protein